MSSHQQIHGAFLTHNLSGNRTARPETKDDARAADANPARRPRRALVRRMPASAPPTLFYQCRFHDVMGGQLNIVSASVPAGGPPTVAVLAGLLLLAAVVLLRKRNGV